MGVSLFVLAALFAVIGILFVYKKQVDIIKDDPTSYAMAQQRFFLSASLIEAIPIILIVVAFVNQDTPIPMEAMLTPVAIIIGLMFFAILFIILQIRVDVTKESKRPVLQFSLVAMMLVLAIPAVAIIMLVLSGDI